MNQARKLVNSEGKSAAPNEWKKRFGEITDYIRKEYGWDSEEVAKGCGISAATLRAWKTGRSAPVRGSHVHKKLVSYLRDRIQDDPTRTKKVSERITGFFGSEHIVELQNIEKQYPATPEFIIEVLDYCLFRSRNINQKKDTEIAPTGRDQMVFFDFDGTLSVSSSNRTTWERIWVTLGYDVREC